MIILLRVYMDGRVIHAEAYDHDEMPVDHRHPTERCRCFPSPTWQRRESYLRETYKQCKVTVTGIYRQK